MEYFVKKLEDSLIGNGRCLVCTLKTPCAHTANQREAQKEVKKKPSYWRINVMSLPPNLEKLEKIEKFRENRVSQHQARLNQLILEEGQKREEIRGIEQRRVRHAEEQKKKVLEYREYLKDLRKKIARREFGSKNSLKIEENNKKNAIFEQKDIEKSDQNKCSIGFFKTSLTDNEQIIK